MRTDRNLARNSFRFSESWKKDEAKQSATSSIDDRLEGFEVRDDGSVAVHSLSGNERNRLFMNRGGTEFENSSNISGLDNPADSRGWVLLDYDRDGWQDVALVNANTPLVNLYRNQIGEFAKEKTGGIIALRFVGGGEAGFACRDGFGAMAEVTLANGTKLKREHRCGDGYAVQNSKTMIIGIGANEEAKVQVRWPSGRTTGIGQVKEGTLVTVYENRSGNEATREEYRKVSPGSGPGKQRQKFPLSRDSEGEVQIYTTTASWCAACLGHLPALTRLKESGATLFGVPVDPNDEAETLVDYVEKKRPPYQMLSTIGPKEKEAVTGFLAKELQMQNPVLPSSVITDAHGNVLEVMPGIPTLSQVRKWQHATR